jgi:hypothetical protein
MIYYLLRLNVVGTLLEGPHTSNLVCHLNVPNRWTSVVRLNNVPAFFQPVTDVKRGGGLTLVHISTFAVNLRHTPGTR